MKMRSPLPRPVIGLVTLGVLGCTTSSGPTPLSEPGGTILAESNQIGMVAHMIVGTPGDSAWGYVPNPDRYLDAYGARFLGTSSIAISVTSNRYPDPPAFVYQYEISRIAAPCRVD